jgi:Zn-dependent M16 (insulinase) family peptidase
MYFCSYRDPNLKETLRVYDDSASFFRKFKASVREIEKYIIGTISKLDHPLTPSMKGEIAAERYIRNISYSDVQKAREEVLGTQLKHIRSYADMIDEAMDKNMYCVLGNEAKIKENRELFEALVDVF